MTLTVTGSRRGGGEANGTQDSAQERTEGERDSSAREQEPVDD